MREDGKIRLKLLEHMHTNTPSWLTHLAQLSVKLASPLALNIRSSPLDAS